MRTVIQLSRVLLMLAAACCAPLSLAQTRLSEPVANVSREVTLSGAVERAEVLTVEDLKKFPCTQIVDLVRPPRAGHPGEKDNLR